MHAAHCYANILFGDYEFFYGKLFDYTAYELNDDYDYHNDYG